MITGDFDIDVLKSNDTNTSGMNVASLNRLNMPILKMKKAY